VAHTCKPSTCKGEAGGWRGQGYLGLHSETLPQKKKKRKKEKKKKATYQVFWLS
jgi:hypothetical protein